MIKIYSSKKNVLEYNGFENDFALFSFLKGRIKRKFPGK